ncbi:indole-3-glycerol phosphate synthase TrpC [uncultured Ilyobacter sp.]|uniref:indole-3-glycerol phosphate synthase TrpC n=1 Tax=uncultured Ilyobacter sp. TaxID=544433 RepID=UPI0029F56A36|nr:indole-3-glycerol phosphate synthase TrpC [uncultured Ilyobacter sp.]
MILDEIVKSKKEYLKKISLDKNKLAGIAKNMDTPPSFYEAMKKSGLSIIGEVKKASPSKGVIKEMFDHKAIAAVYDTCVDAVSVLTEVDYFKGNPQYLKEVSEIIKLPTLCKDFIIDEVQIYEARTLGASAVLLIVSILDDETLKKFIGIARDLKMEPLVEAHSDEEVKRALKAGAKIIGINNRDLKTFNVDLNNCIELSKNIPEDVLVIGESGISRKEDVKKLKNGKISGVLIGEAFMRSESIEELARELKEEFND